MGTLKVIKKFLKNFQKSVDKPPPMSYNNIRDVEHNKKHQSSSPIVQSVEHLTVNQGVVGSSPTRGARNSAPSVKAFGAFLCL